MTKPKYESLADFADSEAKARLAYLETPEGKAEFERSMEKMRKEAAIQVAQPAPTPYQMGADACLCGDDREPPSDLPADQRAEWFAGWDSEDEND